MDAVCARCRAPNRPAARFCSRCGLSLETGIHGSRQAGQVRDPHSAPLPTGFVPVENAANLYFRWESAFGGEPVLGTEGVRIELFNAGYGLKQMRVELTGEGRDGCVVFAIEHELAELPREGRESIEVGSYQIAAPLRIVRVGLVAAEFAADSDQPQ